MQKFCNSQPASAFAIPPNLSMSLRFPNPFLHGDSGTGKLNGIFERWSARSLIAIKQSGNSHSNLNPVLEKLLPAPEL